MNTLLKLKNARKVVKLLGNAGSDSQVLVLYDLFTDHNVEALAIALSEAGAGVHLMQIEGSSRHGRQLSEITAQAMKASDLVIGLTRANIAHTQARQEATRAGVPVRTVCTASSVTTLGGGTGAASVTCWVSNPTAADGVGEGGGGDAAGDGESFPHPASTKAAAAAPPHAKIRLDTGRRLAQCSEPVRRAVV